MEAKITSVILAGIGIGLIGTAILIKCMNQFTKDEKKKRIAQIIQKWILIIGIICLVVAFILAAWDLNKIWFVIFKK